MTPETGEAGGSCKISFNGRAPTTSSNTLVAVDSTNQPGTYYLELSTSELQYPGILSVRYKSANTAEFVHICQIMAFDPYTQFGMLGGGVAGPDIDYKRIQKLVNEAVAKIPVPVMPESPEQEKTDLRPVIEAIVEAKKAILAREFPKTEPTDLSSISDAIKAAETTITKAIAGIPQTDLSGIDHKLDAFNDAKIPEIKAAAEEILSLLEKLKSFFGDDMDELKEKMQKMIDSYESSPRLVIQGGKQ